MLESVADNYDIDLKSPWEKLTTKQQQIVLHGTKGKLTVKYKNRYGRSRQYSTEYEGVIPWIKRRHQGAESDWAREQYEGYMREVPCRACNGARLKPYTLAITVGGKNIAEVCEMPIGESSKFLAALELSERDQMIAERVTKEINARLGFLLDVGLDYLTLSRNAGTLAGGEAQRIRLASQIGSGLVGTLYVLDEPSIGLHQRDNRRLIDTLTETARPRQHRDHRRARRGDDPRERLDRRHRSGCRRARRRGRLQRAGEGHREGQGVGHRPVPLRRASRYRCRRSGGRPSSRS